MSFRDFPLRYDMSGGSVKISLSCLWTRPGGIALQRAILLYGIPVLWLSSLLSDDFLSLNLTSERCFSTTLVGHPLFRRRFSKFFIFSSKICSQKP